MILSLNSSMVSPEDDPTIGSGNNNSASFLIVGSGDLLRDADILNLGTGIKPNSLPSPVLNCFSTFAISSNVSSRTVDNLGSSVTVKSYLFFASPCSNLLFLKTSSLTFAFIFDANSIASSSSILVNALEAAISTFE